MRHISNKLIKHKTLILIIFIVSTLFSILLAKGVGVNYDLIKYLPKDSESTVSLNVMNEAFDTAPPNLRILVKNVSITKAMEYKSQLSKIDGVNEIIWLDDTVDITQPIEVIDSTILESWYVDNNALFTAFIDSKKLSTAIPEIRKLVGEDVALSGEAVNENAAQETADTEVTTIMMFVIPLILFILLMTTSSWFEPVLFMICIGVAILLNNGTNIIFGEISFLTKTSASILQLAVSMDYSIFLLHRFAEYRREGLEVKPAMAKAMEKSFSSIFASGLTTIMGFAALIFMRFGLGMDMGIVLAKGIFFSLISVMLLLPALTIISYKLIDKTHHRSFMPGFKKFGKLVPKMFIPVCIVIAILIVPSFLAQKNNAFLYGSAAMTNDESSNEWKEENQIDSLFGKLNQLVILVPSDDIALENELIKELYKIKEITSITSYTQTVGNAIPRDYLPSQSIEQLVSGGYSRLILNVNMVQESDRSFEIVEKIREVCKAIYGDAYYFTGGSVNVYDMKETVVVDNKIVSIISIIGIGLVILLTFRSITIPIILVLVIETSIWINLSVPYFSGTPMAYMGFMIISSVQLGATVDYAILFANRYRENRRIMSKKLAISQTISDTTGSILTSASILTIAGIILGIVSSNAVTGELGILIGRGAALSAILVLFFLPALLYTLDFVIQKTSISTKFLNDEQDRKGNAK